MIRKILATLALLAGSLGYQAAVAPAASAHGCYTQVAYGYPASYGVTIFGAGHGHACVGWLVVRCSSGPDKWAYGYTTSPSGKIIGASCAPYSRTGQSHWAATG